MLSLLYAGSVKCPNGNLKVVTDSQCELIVMSFSKLLKTECG